jgi:hypothetical protein
VFEANIVLRALLAAVEHFPATTHDRFWPD